MNTFPLLNTTAGYLVLFFYTILATILTLKFTGNYNKTKEGFLVANRQLGYLQGSMSVAAAWIWAPAMFISCLQGYINGIAGVGWMIIGNFFSVFLFGLFAPKIKNQFPEGFTLSGYLKEKYDSKVQGLVGFETIMLSIAALSINILAGSQAISFISGIDYHLISIVIPLISLSYALRGGFKASVITEMIKIVVFLSIWLILIGWTVNLNNGFDTVIAGFGGRTGNGTTLWGTDFTNGILIGFGLPTLLSLMSGTWADNNAYQRIFSIQKDKVLPSFITGSFLAITVTISGGIMGMLAAGMHLEVPASIQTYTNLLVFGMSLPVWTFYILIFVIFASLISVIDSQLGTAASLVGNDIYNIFNKHPDDKKSILWSRLSMIAVSVLAILIVNIPGITLLSIFLVYGIGRATIWWPVMITLINKSLINKHGMFYGILLSWIFGYPIYLYGQYTGDKIWTLCGTLLAVFGSGLMCIVISYLTRTEIKD
jgi:Na+/proline symporter